MMVNRSCADILTNRLRLKLVHRLQQVFDRCG